MPHDVGQFREAFTPFSAELLGSMLHFSHLLLFWFLFLSLRFFLYEFLAYLQFSFGVKNLYSTIKELILSDHSIGRRLLVYTEYIVFPCYSSVATGTNCQFLSGLHVGGQQACLDQINVPLHNIFSCHGNLRYWKVLLCSLSVYMSISHPKAFTYIWIS